MRNTEFVGERHTNRGFLAGVICGAAVGTVAGLLMATKPGADLRREMADSARKLRRQASDTYNHAAAAVSDVVERGQNAIKHGREAFEHARQQHDPDGFRTAHTSERIS